MKKFWLIMKIVYLILAAMLMLWFGTECLNAACEQWFSFYSIVGLVSAISFYCVGYKGCRLAVEEIAKEVTK